MKKIYLLITALAFSFNALLAQAPPEIIHYDFNTPGPSVPNLASNPPPGTGTGTLLGSGLTIGGTGMCGGALLGTGTSGGSDYINTAWTTSLSGSWTIAFWTNSITPSTTLWYIFGDNASFRCFTNGAAGANNWLLRSTGLTDMLISNGAVTGPAHNVFVFDAANSQGRMYLNGVLQGTVTQNPAATFIGTTPFKVGAYATNTNLSGMMDEFRIYSRALTNQEVQQISLGGPTSTTVNINSCGPYTSPYTTSVYPTTGAYTETFVACGGTSTSNINLTVTPAPTLSVTASSDAICSGSSVTLTANGSATSFTWGASSPNTNSLVVTPASTTIYSVTGNGGGVCNVTRTVNIGVTSTPTIGYTSSGTSLCFGASVNITATGATNYSWSTGATTNTISESPQTNTVYMVSSVNGSCTGVTSISVTVNPSPTVNLTASSNTMCTGNNVTLTASGAQAYAWSTSSTDNSITPSPINTTTYTVTGISNNCADTKTIAITVFPTPAVSVSASTLVVCSGSNVVLTGAGATTYSWNTGSTNNPTNVAPLTSTAYVVTGTTGNCSKDATVNITVNLGPNITIIPTSTSVCLGNSVTLNANGAFSYTWNTNATGGIITDAPTTATTYTVWGSAVNNCLSTATIDIAVNPNPVVTAVSNNPEMCKGESATVTASGGASYMWSNSTSTTNVLVVTPPSTRTYTVEGTDANGCTGKAVFTQTVNECVGITDLTSEKNIRVYPNPVLDAIFVDLNIETSASAELFNLTGQLIAKQTLQKGINRFNLANYPSGVYYLKISCNGMEPQTTRIVKE